jgi:hypothetical protein
MDDKLMISANLCKQMVNSWIPEDYKTEYRAVEPIKQPLSCKIQKTLSKKLTTKIPTKPKPEIEKNVQQLVTKKRKKNDFLLKYLNKVK